MSPDDPQRYRLRPAQPGDLAALERLAAASAIGISSLSTEREQLRDALARSATAFEREDDDVSGEETYLFVLEDRARGHELIGTAGIAASAGFHDRFYCYRNEFIVQASAALNARNRIHTLHLCHDLTGVTLLTGFHIDPAYAHTLAPQLLSRGRLLFIAEHAARFSDRIAAENPGLADDSGRCPFWDAVGRRFFDLDYPAAEAMSGGRSHKAWIAELMPQAPIYVPLLPDEAQVAIGQLHPVGQLPFDILMDEGFDVDNYVNLFDAGPTADGRVGLLRSVQQRRVRQPLTGDAGAAQGRWQIVASRARAGFRALLLPQDGGELRLDAAQAQALGWRPGLSVSATPLAGPHGADAADGDAAPGDAAGGDIGHGVAS